MYCNNLGITDRKTSSWFYQFFSKDRQEPGTNLSQQNQNQITTPHKHTTLTKQLIYVKQQWLYNLIKSHKPFLVLLSDFFFPIPYPKSEAIGDAIQNGN